MIFIVNCHNSRNVVTDGIIYTTQAPIRYIVHSLRTLQATKMARTAISHVLLDLSPTTTSHTSGAHNCQHLEGMHIACESLANLFTTVYVSQNCQEIPDDRL